MKKYNWLRIDTASIMFTCLSTKKWGRTFRASAIMSEPVDKELLTRAVAELREGYPSIYSCLKKGFFWNYQECCEGMPEIREETADTLLPITYRNDGRPDFRILYYKNRISVESAHHIADGKGMSTYITALLERYTELCENPDSQYSRTPLAEELENSFNRYYIKGGETVPEDESIAYQLPSEIENSVLQLIFMMMPVEQLVKKAREKAMTVTEYLAAALILGTVRQTDKPITLPISIGIPVNLRRLFPSESVRNFTVQSKIDYNPQGRTDISFDEICDCVRGQLAERITPEQLQRLLNRYGSLSNNPVLKLVPNFIKLPVLRMKQHKSHAANTTILTNTGDTAQSERLEGKLIRVEGVNGDTSGYGLPCTCSALSYGDLFTLCFSLCSKDVSWPRECIRVLSEQGLNIRVESSTGGKGNEM